MCITVQAASTEVGIFVKNFAPKKVPASATDNTDPAQPYAILESYATQCSLIDNARRACSRVRSRDVIKMFGSSGVIVAVQ